MRTIRNAISLDSYVAITHDTLDGRPWDESTANDVVDIYAKTDLPLHFRSRDEVSRMMDGLKLVEPGVVTLEQWFPNDYQKGDETQLKATRWVLGAIGRR
jgi:hypothetical protein